MVDTLVKIERSERSRGVPLSPRPWLWPLIVVGGLGVAVAGGLLAAEQPWLAAAALVLLPLAAAIFIWPDVATLTVMFILYANVAVVAVRFHGVPYLVGAAFPLLLVLPLASYLIIRRQRVIFTPALPLVMLFGYVQLLSALFSEDIQAATEELFIFLVEGLALFFLITNAVRAPAMLRRVIWVLLLAGGLLAAIPAYQQLTQTFENDYGGFAQLSEMGFRTGEETLLGEVRQPRLAGAIGEQNRFAQVLLVLVPLGLFRFWGERARGLRLLALVLTGLIVLGLALAFSRGAAVGFVLLLLTMVLLRVIRLSQFLAFLLAAGLVLAALPQYRVRLTSLLALTTFFAEDSTQETDGAIEGRSTEMVAAVMVFADHPLLGVGPGMFKYYAKEYGDLINAGVLQGTREAHSLFLGIAADTGILGLITFVAILAVTCRNLLRVRRRFAESRPDLANMATSFLLTLVAYLASGLFLHFAYVRYFWLSVALAEAAVVVAQSAGKPPLVVQAQRPSLNGYHRWPVDERPAGAGGQK